LLELPDASFGKIRLKSFSEDNIKANKTEFELKHYCRSETHYLFVVLINENTFCFVQKSLEEVAKLAA